MKHIITMDDFCDIAFDNTDIPFISKRELASSSGGEGRKSLKVLANIKSLVVSFEVFDGLTNVTCYTLENAIRLYNKLP